MFILEIQEHGATELQLAFQRLEVEFQNWKPQFEKLEPESTTTIHRVFEQEGPGWLELRPSTVAQKSKHYPGKTILRRTDRLYLSFAKGNAGNIARIEALSAEFGSDIAYGIYHQDTRPIIRITDQDENRFIEIVVTDKNRRLQELGFTLN
jgi:hypothetical protein